MKQRAAFGLAIVSVAAIWSNSALADGAFAVGMPVPTDASRGVRYSKQVNYSDASTAANEAMKDCHNARNANIGAACKLIATFKDQCVAVAVNGDAANSDNPVVAVGWAISPSSAGARAGALADCEGMRAGRKQACQVEGRILCDGAGK